MFLFVKLSANLESVFENRDNALCFRKNNLLQIQNECQDLEDRIDKLLSIQNNEREKLLNLKRIEQKKDYDKKLLIKQNKLKIKEIDYTDVEFDKDMILKKMEKYI